MFQKDFSDGAHPAHALIGASRTGNRFGKSSLKMNLIKLKQAAREIADNWEGIERLEAQVFEKGTEWIREMALQGQRLIHLKTQMKHGEWLPWCERNLAGRYEKAKQCMRIATNWERVPNLDQATSLRQALALCAEKTADDDGTEPRRWPPAIEAGLKLAKFVGYVERFPVTTWPPENQAKAREELLPVAKQLWPEKFNA